MIRIDDAIIGQIPQEFDIGRRLIEVVYSLLVEARMRGGHDCLPLVAR
jgi:hypothetical protein